MGYHASCNVITGVAHRLGTFPVLKKCLSVPLTAQVRQKLAFVRLLQCWQVGRDVGDATQHAITGVFSSLYYV